MYIDIDDRARDRNTKHSEHSLVHSKNTETGLFFIASFICIICAFSVPLLKAWLSLFTIRNAFPHIEVSV